jgi:hypothetical protein
LAAIAQCASTALMACMDYLAFFRGKILKKDYRDILMKIVDEIIAFNDRFGPNSVTPTLFKFFKIARQKATIFFKRVDSRCKTNFSDWKKSQLGGSKFLSRSKF